MSVQKVVAVLMLGALASAIAVPSLRNVTAAENAPAEKVVVHLSKLTNDLHPAFMALKLATAIQEKGGSVTLFLDIEGVRLADKRQPLDLHWGQSHGTLVDVYDKFVDAGGTVVVCPHCAHAVGLSSDQLRQGATIATEEGLPMLLLHADKILDY